jgi:uncharacterized protein YjbJ (UPF0337 family)
MFPAQPPDRWLSQRQTDQGIVMNWDIIAGDWKQFKGQVKEKWGKLSNDQLDMIAGRRDQLAGMVQETYGITKDQAERQIKAFEEIQKQREATAKL